MASSEERFPILRPARGRSQVEPTTYINGVSITVSPWDFCLLFSRALPAEPLSEDPQARPNAQRERRELAMQGEVVQRIVMSPEHAKAMVSQLAENVAMFESEFGTIPAVVEQRPPEAEKPQPRTRNRRPK
jgi:hypothetical protein